MPYDSERRRHVQGGIVGIACGIDEQRAAVERDAARGLEPCAGVLIDRHRRAARECQGGPAPGARVEPIASAQRGAGLDRCQSDAAACDRPRCPARSELGHLGRGRGRRANAVGAKPRDGKQRHRHECAAGETPGDRRQPRCPRTCLHSARAAALARAICAASGVWRRPASFSSSPISSSLLMALSAATSSERLAECRRARVSSDSAALTPMPSRTPISCTGSSSMYFHSSASA